MRRRRNAQRTAWMFQAYGFDAPSSTYWTSRVSQLESNTLRATGWSAVPVLRNTIPERPTPSSGSSRGAMTGGGRVAIMVCRSRRRPF